MAFLVLFVLFTSLSLVSATDSNANSTLDSTSKIMDDTVDSQAVDDFKNNEKTLESVASDDVSTKRIDKVDKNLKNAPKDTMTLSISDYTCYMDDIVTVTTVMNPAGVTDGVLMYSLDDDLLGTCNIANVGTSFDIDTYGYDPGVHTILVEFTASLTYESTSTTSDLTILKDITVTSDTNSFTYTKGSTSQTVTLHCNDGYGYDTGDIDLYIDDNHITSYTNVDYDDYSIVFDDTILASVLNGSHTWTLSFTPQNTYTTAGNITGTVNIIYSDISFTTSTPTITADVDDVISIPFALSPTATDGHVSVSYGGGVDNIVDIDGSTSSIIFDTTGYLPGEYPLILRYYDSIYYKENTTSLVLYLYQPTTITADRQSVNVVLGEGNSYTVNFETSRDSFDDVIWGSIDVYIDNQIIDTLIIDDTTGNQSSIVLDDYNMENLAPGSHSLTAVFTTGDTYIEESSTTVTLNVEGDVELLLPENITVMTTDSIVIPVNTTFNNNKLTTGVLTFYINNAPVGTLDLSTLNNNITVSNNYNPGTYTIRVDYNDQTGVYTSTHNTTTLYIRSNTIIETSVLNDTIRNTTFTVSLIDARSNTFDGLINITLPSGNKRENIAVTNGLATITLDNLSVGTNTFTIEYPGDNIYNPATKTLNIEVVKLNSTTTATVTNTSVRNTTITVSVMDEKTGTPVTSGDVEIINTADNTVVGRGTLDNTGTTTITTTLSVQGNYNLRVDYKGNTMYNTSHTSLATITVTGRTSQTQTSINNNTYKNTTITVTVKDPVTNTIITNAPITITLPNGTTINTNTGESGSITVPLDIPVGSNTITVEFTGNNDYNASATTQLINVGQRQSTTTAQVTNSSVGNVTLSVTVTDKTTGDAVTSGNVEIVDKDGNTVGTGSIDTNGEATITTSITSKDITQLTVQYLGNTNYTTSQYSIDDLVVVGRLSDIIFKPLNTTYANTSLNITVKDPVTDTPIPNAQVTITYPDGTTETHTTDANGNYTITHTMPVGENTITVEFTGNDEYNTTTKTYTFTVTQRESQTTATICNNTIRNTTITVTVTDKTTGQPVTSGNIEIVNIDTREVVGRGTLSGTNKINITTNIDTTGSYNLRVDFKGNTNYTSSSYTLDAFNVQKRTSNIDTTVNSNVYQNTSINITLTDPVTDTPIVNAPVTITLPNGTTLNRITDNNGKIILEVDLPVGDNTLTVHYNGNDYYNSSTDTLTVNVVKRASNTMATVTNATIRNTTITVTVTNQVNSNPITSGEILIKDTNTGDIVGRGTLSGTNIIIIDTSIDTKGTYNLLVEYQGNSYYNSSSYTLNSITVTGRTSTIETTVNNQTKGNISINITLKDPVTDTPILNSPVTITYPNSTTQTITTDEHGNITITPDLPVGENTITIRYSGDDEYNTTTKTLPMNVAQRESTTHALITNNTIRNTTITVTVNDKITSKAITTGDIEITNTQTGTLIATGTLTGTNTINITLNQPAGTYNLTVNYLGNANYTPSSTTIKNLNIEKRTSQINITNINNTITDTRINITVYDPITGEKITNAPITITLPNGTTINTHTGNTGTIIQTLTLNAEDNTITVTYNGNTIYNSTTTTYNINVEKLESRITVNRQTAYIGENITLNATITDTQGNLINGGRVAFKLNDITLKDDNEEVIYATVNNGKASITYFIPYNYQAKTYKISAVYSGNQQYKGSRSNTPLLNLKQRQARLALTTNTNLQVNNNMTIHVTITDKQDSTRHVNGFVIFKIDGLTLKDSNNQDIRVTITDNKADYNYTIGPEYSARQHTITAILGNNTYTRSQANTTFNITTTHTTIQLTPLTMTPHSSTQLTGTITDTTGNNIVGSNKIAVKIDGITLKNSKGQPQYYYIEDGQINITLKDKNYTPGEHTVQVVTGARNTYTGTRTTTTLTITQPIEKTIQKQEKTATITNKEFINIQNIQTTTQTNTTNQITITLTDSTNRKITTGSITWKQDNKTIDTQNITNGISKLNHKFPQAGTYNLTVTYNDNTGKYQRTTKTFPITVVDPRIATTIKGNNQKTLVGDTITYTLTTTDKYKNKIQEGNITTQINNKTIINKVNNGITIIPITLDKAGTYQITNTYTGTKNYQPSTNTNTITVTKKTPKLTIQTINTTAGTTATITIKVTTQDNTPLDGKITLTLLNNTKTINVQNGQANTTVHIPITQANKNTTITATYHGNQYYNNKTLTTTFTPLKQKTIITITKPTIKAGLTNIFTATITTQNNTKPNTGTVIWKINGQTLKNTKGETIQTTIKDGTSTLNYNIPHTWAGKQINITATYTGSNNYNTKQTTQNKINIPQLQAKAKITITPTTPQTKDNITIKITITDKNTDKKITTNDKIAIKINQKTIATPRLKNGSATIQYKLPLLKTNKTHNITVVYGNKNYKRLDANKKFNIQRINTTTTLNTITIKKGQTLHIKTTIKDTHNETMQRNNTYCIKLNQKTIHTAKLKNGILDATIPLNYKPRTYTLTIKTGNNPYYNGLTKNTKLTITN